MKRYALTIKILLGIFATFALVVILLGWRLSIGPIALDWAGDYFKKALVTGEDTLKIDFKDAVLAWKEEASGNNTQSSGLLVVFYDFEIVDHKRDFSLLAPKAAVRVSSLAMLRGLFAPTEVIFSGLSIDYSLTPDVWLSNDKRPFLEQLESFIKDFQSSNALPFQIAEELLAPPQSSAIAGYLRQISLQDTKITIEDQKSGQIWQIPQAHLSLIRTDYGINVGLTGDIKSADQQNTPVEISIKFDNAKKEAITNLEFLNFRPSDIAGKVDELSGLSKFNIPGYGNIEFTIDRNFDIPVVAFSLALGKGEINPADLYQQPLNVTSAALNGYIKKSENSIVLDEISLQLGQTHLSGSGLLYGSKDAPGIAITADISDLPFLDLKSYWPGQLGKGAYLWISKNIDAGVVPQGKLEVYIKPEMWDRANDITIPNKEVLPEDAVTFKFDFDNITAHYLRPMPILTDISGKAELNLRSFRMIAQDGKIENLTINKADLLFSNIHVKGGGVADITLELDGTVEEVLRVIDYKPLGFPSKYGIKQGTITGQAKAQVNLKFPLLKKVGLKDVIFQVDADIEGLQIPKLTDAFAIDNGKLHLNVDGDGIIANGDILLNGIDLKANWFEKFGNQDDFPTKYVVNGLIEGPEWEQLNLPFEPYIEGPVEIDLSLFGKGGAIIKGEGQFNLLNSLTKFGPIGWKKERGKSGHVGFDLNFNGPKQLNVNNVILQSDSLRATIELDIVDDFVTRFFIPSLTMKNTDMIMLMEWNSDKKYYLSTLTGKSFDATSLIEILMSTGGEEERMMLPNFNLDAEVDQLLTKNNVKLVSSILTARYRDKDFTHIKFDSKLLDDKDIKIAVKPDAEKRRLTFTSNNAGEALRGLGMFNLGVGGEIDLEAEMVNHEHGISIGGQASIKDFKVIESPGFSKLLEEKKFSKAKEELEKGGLSFNNFDMNFRTYNGVMEITKGRARGPMLGITIDGTVDQSYDEMSISGTLIPAYGLNSLLSNIPLIGTILTGGKGQGIFAATYRVKGPLDNPEIKINPLAALAPGILRNIFSAIGGKKEKTLREQAEDLEKITPNTKPEKKPD